MRHMGAKALLAAWTLSGLIGWSAQASDFDSGPELLPDPSAASPLDVTTGGPLGALLPTDGRQQNFFGSSVVVSGRPVLVEQHLHDADNVSFGSPLVLQMDCLESDFDEYVDEIALTIRQPGCRWGKQRRQSDVETDGPVAGADVRRWQRGLGGRGRGSGAGVTEQAALLLPVFPDVTSPALARGRILP